ncbi:unnamed protein product [Linum tenue]|uniref:Uncharacterized protein n=2 Tax=Linum tenue TaxID=586396 RepID=A0AAV0QQH7_9ROSI|nr:unnamed protein product [Linum tenue]
MKSWWTTTSGRKSTAGGSTLTSSETSIFTRSSHGTFKVIYQLTKTASGISSATRTRSTRRGRGPTGRRRQGSGRRRGGTRRFTRRTS